MPFPEEAFAVKEVQQSILMCVISRLAKDTRCVVHRVLLPVREPRPGWIHIVAPSSPDCPDQGELFGEMVIFHFLQSNRNGNKIDITFSLGTYIKK